MSACDIALRRLWDVEDAAERLRQAKAAMKASMDSAMAVLLPVGTMIDTHARREAPLWARGVKTCRGNDRGATVFELASAPTVDIDTSHPTLSRWRAGAYPISPKTGQRMSGRSHGPDGNRDDVTLTGLFVDVPETELRGDAYSAHCNEYLLRVIAAAEVKLAETVKAALAA